MVDMPLDPTQTNPIYLTYMYKKDLALNNLQWLICYKTQPKPKPSLINWVASRMVKDSCSLCPIVVQVNFLMHCRIVRVKGRSAS